MAIAVPTRPRNDPLQYDDLAAEWWRPRGAFEALHWLAAARAELIPPPTSPRDVLLDVACGGGLMAPHVHGYRHVGVDIGRRAVEISRSKGIEVVRGDAARLPFADESVRVVVAGEVFEHVPDLEAVVQEIGRVLSPGGTLVCDTLADTRLCKLLLVDVAERLPGVAPPGIHDPALFVVPAHLQELCDKAGIDLRVRGLRPIVTDALLWQLRLRRDVRMVPMRWTGVVYQGQGVKR